MVVDTFVCSLIVKALSAYSLTCLDDFKERVVLNKGVRGGCPIFGHAWPVSSTPCHYSGMCTTLGTNVLSKNNETTTLLKTRRVYWQPCHTLRYQYLYLKYRLSVGWQYYTMLITCVSCLSCEFERRVPMVKLWLLFLDAVAKMCPMLKSFGYFVIAWRHIWWVCW